MADRRILLTGATGFVAKRICLDLLERGDHVTGTTRNPERIDELRAALTPHLSDPERAQSHLQLVVADLAHDDGWVEAFRAARADAVIHTASPLPLTPPRDPVEVIRPAVEGIRRVLDAAFDASVHRVVLTSSAAAILHCDKPGGNPQRDESDWTDPDHPTATAYTQSKTLAERAAWDFAARHRQMQLSTINPGLVLGRPLDTRYGTSLQLVERLLSGRDLMLPDYGVPVVDLADVSAMHLAALENSAAIGQRFLAVAGFIGLPEIGRHLAARYPGRRIPTRVAPDMLMRLIGLFDPTLRSIVPQLGIRYDPRSDRARDVLGIRFTPPLESLNASAEFLIANSGKPG